MNKFYITTAIAYVNAAPHIGHALELIQADVLARYHRLQGDETFLLTGTDEHGVKIYEAAQKAGLATQQFVDKNANIFLDMTKKLLISNDDFIRTTSEFHKKGVKKMWQKMVARGDIYKGVYKGNYCVGCESFIAEKDLDADGNCPIHKMKPQILEEENYFFKLSRYSDQIKKAILDGVVDILPVSRKNEFLNIIGEEGLHDVSFSRPKNVLPWCVDVPDDPNQGMYVWCDALSNYITALGYGDEGENFQKFWPVDVHLIGKDILRFHAGIWIGMLISAEIELPKAIYVHGFIISGGQKMSKSLGNVVDPFFYVNNYGAEALRYYLLREIPTTDDGDFTHERFVQVYNSELANGMGNLVNRVVMMTEKYCESRVPKIIEDTSFYDDILGFVEKYRRAFGDFDLKRACEEIVGLVDFGNKYIDDKKPWLLAKDLENGREELDKIMYELLELLRFLAMLMMPILPQTALKIAKQIGLETISWDQSWALIKQGAGIHKEENLFPRIEE